MDSKQCSKCKETASLAEFNTRPDRKSGYRSECKSCQYKTQAKRKRIIPPVVQRARSRLYYAIKTGKMHNPGKCSSCGSQKNIGGHHNDYGLALDVIWLCSACHNRLHRKLQKAS